MKKRHGAARAVKLDAVDHARKDRSGPYGLNAGRIEKGAPPLAARTGQRAELPAPNHFPDCSIRYPETGDSFLYAYWVHFGRIVYIVLVVESTEETNTMRTLLRETRIKAGMSAFVLAEKAGTTEPRIYSFERNRYRPRLDEAKRIASALGEKPEALFPELFLAK